jgi:nucleotide-binding universal stress UspA family protein
VIGAVAQKRAAGLGGHRVIAVRILRARSKAMRILLAVDGSESSNAAIAEVARRSWPPDSTLRVLSVTENLFPPASSSGMSLGEVNYPELNRQLADQAHHIAERAAAAIRHADLSVTTKVRNGDPRVEIVDEATERGTDLIIVGSHGRTGLRRWLVGSVAEYVVRHALCSVEVARVAAEPR